MNRICSKLLDWLFPPRCVFCDEVIPSGKETCTKCAKVLPAVEERYLPVRNSERFFTCYSAYVYDGLPREALIRLKFHDRRESGAYFGIQLAKMIKEQGLTADLVTAVPISKERLKKRGYNQSELLARPMVEALGIPYVECLDKIRDNAVQHDLTKEDRRKNVQGVYRAREPEQFQKKSLFLVDDILTTGATMQAAAQALLDAGAETVVCVTAAQDPISR